MAKRKKIRTERFELRCSQEELEQWRRTAAVHGVRLSQYARMLLTENYLELPRITENYRKSNKPQTDPALLRQIAAIGNNLNQITYWCNMHKSRQEAKPVERGIQAVREELAALQTRETGNAD